MLNHRDIANLSHLLNAFKSRLAEAFARRDLEYPPMQIKVLRLISSRGACTALHVAQTLDRDKAQVTRLLQALVREGVLLKKDHPSDKRSQLLSLSAHGEQVFADMQAAEQEALAEMSEHLGEECVALLSAALSTAQKTLTHGGDQ